jgi:hypothetical protein
LVPAIFPVAGRSNLVIQTAQVLKFEIPLAFYERAFDGDPGILISGRISLCQRAKRPIIALK